MGPGRPHGFTLVEMLVALAILGVLGAGLVVLWNAQNRAYARQSDALVAAQAVQAGMDMWAREIRNAGLDPYGRAGSGLTVATRDSVGWTADLNGDGDVDDLGREGDEAVLYLFRPEAATLFRRANGVVSPVAEGIDSLGFRHLDRSGVPTSSLRDVTQVELGLRFRGAGGVGGRLRTRAALLNQAYE